MAEVTMHFNSPEDRFQRALSRTVRTVCFEIERRASDKAPVDTGWLKNSVYTLAKDGGFQGGVPIGGRPALPPDLRKSARRGKNVYQPGVYAEAVAMSQPADGEEAQVKVAASYGIIVEMGSVHSPAQPYLGPATEEVIPQVDSLLATNLKREGL